MKQNHNQPPPPQGERLSTDHPGLQFGARVAIKASISQVAEKLTAPSVENSVDYAVRSTESGQGTALDSMGSRASDVERIRAINIPDGYSLDQATGLLVSQDSERVITTPMSREIAMQQMEAANMSRSSARERSPVANKPVAGGVFSKMQAERAAGQRIEQQQLQLKAEKDQVDSQMSALKAEFDDDVRTALHWAAACKLNRDEAPNDHVRNIEDQNLTQAMKALKQADSRAYKAYDQYLSLWQRSRQLESKLQTK